MEPSPELRTIIDGWFDTVVQGDDSWVDRHVSRRAAARLIGTDPGEWLAGEQVGEFLANEARALGGQVTVIPGDTEAYQEGAVGWGVARPTFMMPDGSTFSPRWSAVFHREAGQWKAVQIHASFGIPNEEVFGS